MTEQMRQLFKNCSPSFKAEKEKIDNKYWRDGELAGGVGR